MKKKLDRRRFRVNKISPRVQCPEYDHLDFGSRFCGTPYCYGASEFGPDWNEDEKYWTVGISCACGCADVIYYYDENEESWMLM